MAERVRSSRVTPDGLKQYAERHIASIRGSVARDEWTMDMWLILKSLMDDEKHNHGVFNEPVDETTVAGYYSVIRNPMDFGTIKVRLEDGVYPTVEAFEKDVHLVFANAVVYNLSDHFVHKAAKQLKLIFEDKLVQAKKRLALEAEKRAVHDCAACEGRICAICNRGCMEYAPPDIRCSPPCKAKIPRNATYYRLGGDRGQHWCQRCYAGLKEEFIGILGQLVRKRDLEQCVNSHVYREAWLRCFRCERWSHMVCTLFVEAYDRNSDPLHSVPDNRDPANTNFSCVACMAETPASATQITALKSPPRPIVLPVADCIPHTPMTEFLEKRVREASVIELMTRPANAGQALLQPRLTRHEAERIASTLKVRLVSHYKSDGSLEARIKKWVETQCFVANRLPGECVTRFPHRSKAICIFQETSPFETILCFTLYVQEYGLECPSVSANRGAVYVSYLDSVPYIRPRRLRTVAYRELMQAYFVWVRQRGFDRCYIWACPPQKGDAYVMYCHPPWQRNPSAERLRKWYSTLFKSCRAGGLVEDETTMFDKHLASFKPIVHTRRSVSSAMSGHGGGASQNKAEEKLSTYQEMSGPFHLESLPYFTGDFIYTELEVVLAQLEQLDSDLTEAHIREWWLQVWGSHATIEIIKEEGTREDGFMFNREGIAFPGTLIAVKPAAKPPPRETLMKLERECCTVHERDEWIMRKISGAVKPQKDNFFVLTLKSPNVENDQRVADSSSQSVRSNPSSPRAAAGMATGRTAVPKALSSSSNKKQKVDEFEEVANMPRTLPPDWLKPDLSEPDSLCPRTCFDYRISFLDLCIVNHLQFNTFRHAKFSSAVIISFLQRSFQKFQEEHQDTNGESTSS